MTKKYKDVMTLTIPENCKEFTDYYDALQEKICHISVLDELLAGIHSVVIIAVPYTVSLVDFHTGMLSKAKGQVLRIAAVLHVLFCDLVNTQGGITVSDVPETISETAIIAAQKYVDTCCQHAAFIAGRGKLEDEINQLTSGEI